MGVRGGGKREGREGRRKQGWKDERERVGEEREERGERKIEHSNAIKACFLSTY